MIASSDLTRAMDRVIALKMKAVDVVVQNVIEPLLEFGNPEKLLGKPYDLWTQQDLARLSQIYGVKEPNALSNLIFRREYQKVRELEEEVK